MEKIKILYIIINLQVGGAEMMLYRLLGELNRDIYDMTVISIKVKNEIGYRIENDYGIPVISLNLTHSSQFFTAIIQFIRLIKTWSPQIVHSHMYHANILARITRLFYRFPVLICTVHNIEERGDQPDKRRGYHIRKYLYRATDFLCDLTTQVCRAGMEEYIKIKAVPSNKIAYVPNGIDTSLFNVDKNEVVLYQKSAGLVGKKVLLAIGSLFIQKDYPNMIAAFSKFRDKMSSAVLLIVGDGPLKSELQELVKKQSLVGQIWFLGLRRDLPLLMGAADIFVMSSSWEGLPTVALEASASKLPIIITDVGGSNEIVIDGKTGFIVPPHDSDALGRAMVQMLEMSEEERARMGLAGSEYIKDNYDIRVVTDHWEMIYQDLLKKAEDL